MRDEPPITQPPMAAPGGCLAAYVDVETTGLGPADELIECAIALFEYSPDSGEIGAICELYAGLREPAVPIGEGARAVHGISPEDVAGRDLDHERARGIFRRADILIAHNAPFDRRFLTKLYPELRRMTWCCSMSGINWRALGHRNRRLQDLLTAYGIATENAHRATDDVLAAVELLKKRNSQGHPHMKELISGGRAPVRRTRWQPPG